jgi:5-epi-alpha-selinene synthase
MIHSGNYTLPLLYCPYPAVLNTHAATVEQYTEHWAIRFKLLQNDSHSYQHFTASKLSRLVARACPTASLKDLTFASDLMTYLFLLDDACDEAAIGRDPRQLKLLFTDLLNIMRQPLPESSNLDYASSTAPTFENLTAADADGSSSNSSQAQLWKSALHDIWQRLPQQASAEWRLRFVANLEQSIQANIWEAANRKQQCVPDMSEYIKMRALTNGFYWCCDLSELIERIQLPVWMREQVEIRHLANIATNVTGWFNDIVSLRKEQARGDVHNLVLILQYQQNLTLEQALQQAILQHNTQVQAFLDLERQLPSFGEDFDAELKRYLAVMHNWMRSNVDWSLESGRYQIDAAIKVTYGIAEMANLVSDFIAYS